jgi:hypothetical protein
MHAVRFTHGDFHGQTFGHWEVSLMECSTLAYSNKLRFNVPLAYPGTPSQGNNPRGKLLQRLGQKLHHRRQHGIIR